MAVQPAGSLLHAQVLPGAQCERQVWNGPGHLELGHDCSRTLAAQKLSGRQEQVRATACRAPAFPVIYNFSLYDVYLEGQFGHCYVKTLNSHDQQCTLRNLRKESQQLRGVGSGALSTGCLNLSGVSCFASFSVAQFGPLA